MVIIRMTGNCQTVNKWSMVSIIVGVILRIRSLKEIQYITK